MLTPLIFAALLVAQDPAVLTWNFANGTAGPADFEPQARPTRITGGVASDKPFILSAPVAEGNYRVTAILGDLNAACSTTIKAESRRLMIEETRTEPGRTRQVAFTVNVRNAKLPPPEKNAPGGDHVRLNDREAGVLHWDDKLALDFTGKRPCLDALEIRRVTGPTLYLAGDSTVTDQPKEPTTSWGQMLTRFFTPDVAIANHAESGETLKSFITGLRLDKILSQIRPGDYLFIQFGHNDMKENWPQTYVEPATTYRQYLKVFIAEARRRGAIPVLVSPMQRRNFDPQGKVRNTLGEFPASMRQTAREENVPLIDLTTMSTALYEALGTEKSWLAFAGGRDATHHSAYGAYELAKCVVEGIKANRLELARYLADDFKSFDPAHPDPPDTFQIP